MNTKKINISVQWTICIAENGGLFTWLEDFFEIGQCCCDEKCGVLMKVMGIFIRKIDTTKLEKNIKNEVRLLNRFIIFKTKILSKKKKKKI
jgi:hypothetical protein